MPAREPRICDEPGCGRVLHKHNKSGFCRHHNVPTQAQREALAERNRSRAYRAKMAATQTATWADPMKRANRMAGMRAAWADPERRERMLRGGRRSVTRYLTDVERRDYVTLMRCGGYRSDEALRIIGRANLVAAE